MWIYHYKNIKKICRRDFRVFSFLALYSFHGRNGAKTQKHLALCIDFSTQSAIIYNKRNRARLYMKRAGKEFVITLDTL